MPKYAIVIASLILVFSLFFVYWMHREFCRRIVVGARANRSRSKDSQGTPEKDCNANARGGSAPDPKKESEKELDQAVITTKITRAINLKVRSTIAHKNCVRIAEEFGSDFTRSYMPTIWQTLADEAERKASLRAKWSVNTVSGVVPENSGSTAGTVLTSGTIESTRTPSRLVKSDSQSSEEDGEKEQNKVREENSSEDERVQNSKEDGDGDENSNLEEDTSNKKVLNSEENGDRDENQIPDTNEDMTRDKEAPNEEAKEKEVLKL